MGFSFMNVNKKLPLFPIHFVLLFCCLCFSSFESNGTDIDKLALLDFKAKLIDPQGVLNSWNDTTHVCNWYGVTCSRWHPRVTVLNLHSSQLVGPISPSMGNLSFLRDLQLQNNSLKGTLPPEIGRLRRLQNLQLTNNSIVGEIPLNISHCSNLISLFLEGNSFFGEIPEELGFLSNLQVFALTVNNLTGTIPPSLGNLTSLSKFSITRNHLVGNIPDSFGKLKNLTLLSVSFNQLSGMVLASLLNLSSLFALDLGINKFYGNLPSNFGTSLPNLRFFSIADNLFNGSIPPSIANTSSLKKLFLDGNKFVGEVPCLKKLDKIVKLVISVNLLGFAREGDLNFISSLVNATKLQLHAINFNNFGGVLPKTIVNLSSEILVLDMEENMISGYIPVRVENLFSIQHLTVGGNKLLGNIPENIGKLQNLQRLGLQGNMFSGNIPFSLGNLTRLIELYMSLNNLQDQIPKSIGQCQELLLLDLSGNNLSGEIPAHVFNLSALSISFSMANNQLSGFLPWQVGHLKSLGSFDISENKLLGEIPNNFENMISLERLYMQKNHFQGPIPSSLSSLRSLRILDLSHNNLSSEIPKDLGALQLQQLNLSYNDFQGKVPIQGIFNNASAISVVGNSRLCGGIPKLTLPTCDIKMSMERHSWRLMILILSCFVGLIILLLVVYLFWFRKKKRESSSSQLLLVNSLLELTYHSLLKATNGFSLENLIGVGSFGSVYKGKLEEGGTLIAVKVLNIQCQGADRSFTVECKALRNIRHRNLVKVLTACSSIDNNGNDFKALVYEFMANGNLEDWLHPSVEINEKASPRNLNFPHRLNIVIDIAFAIDYLHHHCGSTIVHCDLKPSNILLDDEMIAHVGDFGLAKFLSQSIINAPVTHESSSLGVRGTIGYAPPEYGLGNEIPTSGDVYSFGIVLLEMFSGKRPTDNALKVDQDLHRYCRDAIPENLVNILDPTLAEELFAGEDRMKGDQRVFDGLISLFTLGIFCSAQIPKDRPNISDVTKELIVIRNQILKRRTA